MYTALTRGFSEGLNVDARLYPLTPNQFELRIPRNSVLVCTSTLDEGGIHIHVTQILCKRNGHPIVISGFSAPEFTIQFSRNHPVKGVRMALCTTENLEKEVWRYLSFEFDIYVPIDNTNKLVLTGAIELLCRCIDFVADNQTFLQQWALYMSSYEPN